MKKNYTKLLTTAALLFCTLIATAQTGDTLEIQKNGSGKIILARFKPSQNRKMANAATLLKSVLKTQPQNEFTLTKQTVDELGITHSRYQQYYKGVKIEGAEYLVHGKNGNVETMNGSFQDISMSSVTPTLDEPHALAKALAFIGAKKYKWEDAASEKFIKQTNNHANATYYPKGELVIEKDYLGGSNTFKLAWKFTISSLTPNDETLVFVNAGTGAIVNKQSLIYDANTACNAQTKYSGTLGIIGDSYAGGFRLRESRNAVNVQTLNTHGNSNVAAASDFANANINFTNGNWATFAQDQAALDAHWGQEKILDFWRTVFTRNSIDGAGLPVTGYVHYNSGTNGFPNNAAWDVTSHIMYYGDGDGFILNPLTSLDVTAHEFGHGVQQYTSNVTSGAGAGDEAFALNEGLSDIWGACVEQSAAPAKQTWLMGEEIFVGGIFSCVRNMQNPKTTTAYEGQHPDTYHGAFWNAAGDAHVNSTVLSHWFYLLSQGGNGTNDNGNAYFVSGIGIAAARAIVYKAETTYLHARADYNAARNAMISAVRDLNGGVVGSCQEIAVTNAWYAVGVGAIYTGTGNMSISGDNAFCTTSNAYTISNLQPGATVSWNSSSNAIAQPNSPTATSTTLAKHGDGSITLNAVVTNGCGANQSLTISKYGIWVGAPAPSISVTLDCPDGTAFASNTPPGATSFTWHLVNTSNFQETINSNYGSSINYRGLMGTHNIGATYVNTCGTSIPGVIYNVYCPGGGTHKIVVSPNPAQGQISVQLAQADVINPHGKVQSAEVAGKDVVTIQPTYIKQINVYNATGALVKTFNYGQGMYKTVRINVSNLPNGLYHIAVVTDKGSYNEKLEILK